MGVVSGLGVCKGLCFHVMSSLQALPQGSPLVPTFPFLLVPPSHSLLSWSSSGEDAGPSEAPLAPWPVAGFWVTELVCLWSSGHRCMTHSKSRHKPSSPYRQPTNHQMKRHYNVCFIMWFSAELHVRLTCEIVKRIWTRWHHRYWISFGRGSGHECFLDAAKNYWAMLWRWAGPWFLTALWRNRSLCLVACVGAPLGSLPEDCVRVISTSLHTCVNVPNMTYSFGSRKST